MIVPLRYVGDGEFQAPKAFAKQCDAALVIGEQQRWELVNERSAASHKFYFATIAEAWGNLPENLVAELPSPEHMRKHCLCRAGYCDVTKLVCGDNDDALRAALLMKQMDTYAICEVSGRVVTVYRAKSQSVRAMGKKDFEASKTAVLSEIGKLIGADPAELGKTA